ncbi:helix-turn-helix transcriptional regulator [Microbacterium sp. USHLN186]|uniref:helix-turn-helix transcriptional regulator n=1 Tax=Microbacterium sp. USHLN186 TaxID=3081286 RepID=UPI00301ADB24
MPAPLLAWERHARPALETMPAQTPRVVVVGAAGAGKSLALHRLRALVEHPRRRTLLTTAVDDLAGVPAEDVLLVDDLHLLDDRALITLGERAADPRAALIATTRPGPLPPGAQAVVRMLERDTPSIVLGHVSRSDLLDHLDALQRPMAPECVDHILRDTAGVAWLVIAALQHHDPRDCADDPAHHELQRAMAELVAHRLDTVDAALQLAVERICIAGPLAGALPDAQTNAEAATADTSEPDRRHDAAARDDLLLRGYAEGLLLRGGDTAPIIRTAVRRFLPAHRLIALSAALPDTVDQPVELRRLRSPLVADALEARADRLLASSPARAAALYDAAIQCGAAPARSAERRARAAWADGRLDACAAILDAAVDDDPRFLQGHALRLSAAVWSARGMLARADAGYRRAAAAASATTPTSSTTAPATTTTSEQSLSLADADVAALGAGRPPGARPQADTGADTDNGTLAGAPPGAATTMSVAAELLRSGLRRTLAPDVDESCLAELLRAADLYSATGADDALCEPPAVIAAIVALNLGRPVAAAEVLIGAAERRHGGRWARRRLLLWAAWVCVQRAQPARALQLLVQAEDERAWSPRDAVLRHAVHVAVARRQDDATALKAAWQRARGALLRVDPDIYLLHPLGELIVAASQLGDAARVAPQRDRALELVRGLGEPPLWSAHVHWLGVQQGILTSSPALLAPHAKALVAEAPHSRVATGMARAGRVWTEVLAGTVDASAVVSAAKSLAAVGLLWDAARLAGHGAARSADRRVAAQLLACARDLHPSTAARVDTAAAPADDGSAQLDVLSDREIEVARLVLQGKTYAEIGAKIFISPRTAEHHIAHIRRRLGVQTRSEMLARLRTLLGTDESAAHSPHATPVDRRRTIGGSPDATGPAPS